MKRIAMLTIAFLAAAFSMNAAQMSDQTKTVLANIEKANASIITITSPVTETRSLPNGKQFVSKGIFYFSHPNLLAIRYSEPEGDYLVINTEEVGQKKKHGKSFNLSLKRNETMQKLSSTLLCCISGKLIQLAEENNATVTSSEANGVINLVFEAQTKGSRDFKKFELTYDKATMRLMAMALTDKSNVVTKYTMDGAEYGATIDPSVYEL